MAAFPDADLRPGAEIVAMVVGLEELTEKADWVNYRRRPDRRTDSARKILVVAVGIAARFDTPIVAFFGSLRAGFKLSYS